MSPLDRTVMTISVIVPAYNEEVYLPATLESITSAAEGLRTIPDVCVEILVVDNNSQASKTHRDATAAVALRLGAKVVREPEQGISRSRNTGASHAEGDVLVFVDADVIIPPLCWRWSIRS